MTACVCRCCTPNVVMLSVTQRYRWGVPSFCECRPTLQHTAFPSKSSCPPTANAKRGDTRDKCSGISLSWQQAWGSKGVEEQRLIKVSFNHKANGECLRGRLWFIRRVRVGGEKTRKTTPSEPLSSMKSQLHLHIILSKPCKAVEDV